MKNFFDESYQSEHHLNQFLRHLKIDKKSPDLSYLNELIYKHQHIVPFENVSRICDFKEQPEGFSSLPYFLEQQFSKGTGGVCWTSARSFHWLLRSLGFDVVFLYMDPGHVCLKVKLDQDYYVEVGFAAPFFEAKPLHQSFQVMTAAEKYVYDHQGNYVDVIRTPGPVKKLNLEESSIKFLNEEFRKRNIWKENKFLSMILVSKYVDESPLRLKDDVLSEYKEGTLVTTKLEKPQIEKILEEAFQMDPALYFKARKYLES